MPYDYEDARAAPLGGSLNVRCRLANDAATTGCEVSGTEKDFLKARLFDMLLKLHPEVIYPLINNVFDGKTAGRNGS